MKDNREEMATQITQLVGKPIKQSREEIDFSIQRARSLITQSEQAFEPETLYHSHGIIKKTFLEPVGIVLALLPWDFPILEIINVLIPAILAGNSVLLKDNPETPLAS